MNNIKEKNNLFECWNELYPDTDTKILDNFIIELDNIKKSISLKPQEEEWYKDAIVYSLYVDLFNTNFKGLEEKLEYLSNLGVNCLWLLPILDSPMRDAGFDVRDYKKIRSDLFSDNSKISNEETFINFIEKAHEKNIKIIFDIAINHTSDEHFWFKEAKKSEKNPYHDYYIWNKNTEKYKDARIIFKGIETSNWEKCNNEYYFHRFFNFQPDLNYRNYKVLLEMTRNMMYWLQRGVDGFRADAIPYLWKQEGTSCENLDKDHTIIRFYRAVLNYVRPNTLLLAEACQKPKEVVKYFGNNDECNAGYHFPLMPQMFKAISMHSKEPIIKTLSPDITPEIPESCQWFMFLRCHDELSLELIYVSEQDRKYIHDNYCKEKLWDFRQGQGISARLANLMDKNPDKISLAYSVMLTLPGTPVIYYGDEFGKTNDEEYYHKMIKITGKDDTRFLVRGKINWNKLNTDLKNDETLSYKVFSQISNQIKTRKKYKSFGRGDIQHIDILSSDKKELSEILSYYRIYNDEKILVINNLSDKEFNIIIPDEALLNKTKDILNRELQINKKSRTINLNPYSYYWIQL
ncbi:MAG: alpha-glucosidase C-terminal domain-containing protein [Bacteroidales bacterium]|nr:alpha-glucosidase C-terminal domain-containing protein [Bacteroidales bacterium]